MDLTQKQKIFPELKRRTPVQGIMIGLVSAVSALVIWVLIARLGHFPPYILPTPDIVWSRLLQSVRDGSLLRHSAVTLWEVVIGLASGASVATTLGYLLAKFPPVERLLAPYIVASQSVPIVAIAPLLVIIFGPGLFSKVLICALVVFFPVLVNTVVAVRSVPEELHELMRSLEATRWEIFLHLEVPAALPVFLGGLRIGATLSVIGAVVGEFVGAKSGLGFLIMIARGQYDNALVFVAAFALIAMALVLYGLVVLVENRLLSWQQRPEGES